MIRVDPPGATDTTFKIGFNGSRTTCEPEEIKSVH